MQAQLKELSTTALLGTEKRGLPDLPAELQAFVSDDAPTEAQLLTGAAAADLFVRAAREASTDTRLSTESAPADRKPNLSAEAETYLRQMLTGYRTPLLAEFLTAVAKSGKRVPHVYLPEVLELAKRQVDLREAVRDTVDERGVWLARQNPDWSFIASGSGTENHLATFETGSLLERKLALVELRKANPTAAREALNQVWTQENARDRAGLLEALSESLSTRDEAFLEAALKNKSSTVRQVAAELLSQLPDSAYCQRMTARAKPFITFTAGGMLGLKKARLEMSLPDTLPPDAEQDGIDSKNVPYGMGQKAWWFKQIVARVPLSVWTKQAELTKMLDLCSKEDSTLLRQSWTDACVRFQDREQAANLLRHQPDFATVHALAPLLSDEQAAELAFHLFVKYPKLTPEHVILRVLGRTNFTWSQALRRQFHKALKEALPEWKKNWQARGTLASLATLLPPDLLGELTPLAPQDKEHVLFESYREFLGTLEYRRKMLNTLGES